MSSKTKIKTFSLDAKISARFTHVGPLSQEQMNKIAEDIAGDVNAAIDRALKEKDCLHEDECSESCFDTEVAPTD